MANVPVVISTWPFGLPANRVAWKLLLAGAAALDAVEAGVMSCEDDPAVDSVGYGGLPDAAGEVTLDASIIDHRGRCGGVAGLRRVRHAIRAARLVMERTPHVLLVGESATRFALANGLEESDLLSESAAKAYAAWRQKQAEGADARQVGHDTIGMLAIGRGGDLAGACSTSGRAFKVPGRVGDSPIIGAGLYVDAEVGAASATGVGEEVIRVCGSYAVVEQMRRGASPQEAIDHVLRDLARRRGAHDTDVSFVALRADGEAAGGTLRAATNYKYAVITLEGERLVEPTAVFA